MTLLGIDVSHHQGTPDFIAVRRAGNPFAFIKATEGVGYTDPAFAANRTAARAAGVVPGFYAFASGGDPVAEADYFCSVVGPLKPGDLVALDWETTAPNPPAWCKAWLDRVAAKLGVRPLIYINQSTRDGFDWSPVVAGNYGLWLAAYDGSPTVVPSPGRWPAVALKQYTSSGTVPGVPGQVDRNVFFGDATALAAYGYQEADMPLSTADVQTLWWAETVDPDTGQKVKIIDLLKEAESNASHAARDAAAALKLAQATAAAVARLAANPGVSAVDIAAALTAGYKINLVPPPA